MIRIIEQIGLLKSDVKALIVELTVENVTKKEIVKECEDHLQVRLLKEDIQENDESIEEAKLTLEEIDQVLEILVLTNDMANKKRP